MNYLQRSVLTCLLLSAGTLALAQQPGKKKYQGLLWEISGNGLAKPSYLFGTMHVSSKLAFHLSDSFYHCIRMADVVALETDPQRLQEDFSKSSMLRLSAGYMTNMGAGGMSKDAFTIGTYADMVRTGLVYRPEMINHLLYRSFAAREDFEEDTFLDMYIYQVGKKMGKRATGVEDFAESERLMLEAYRDAARDKKTRKQNRDTDKSGDKLNDAYRRGDLDMLDSLSSASFPSAAFLEKFLYKRNENMFRSIDSIIRKDALFAGVGAAHLPGDRGLIHMLRKAGYTLRPIAMTNRDSEQKEQLEKIKAPVTFQPYTSPDGWIKAELPGKLYNFSSLTMLNQLQYADLANGAYYLVSRIRTNALSLGQTSEDVYAKVDSLLYENIPGRIISRKSISNNGHKGFDIVNRTRRGDLQRYQIFITPFEVMIFKLSGTGEYAQGEEAARFFASIQLQAPAASAWTDYRAPDNSFSVRLPHTPVSGSNFALRSLSKRMEYEALDRQNGNSFLVIRKAIPDYGILEEDTTDISFAEESFQLSSFIKQQKSRKFIRHKGRPCLEIVNQHTDKSYTQTRILLHGAYYFVLSARYRGDKKATQAFFDSFTPQNPQYNSFLPYTDTSLHYSVTTAVTPDDDDALMEAVSGGGAQEEEYLYRSRSKVFRSDSTGEEIVVAFEKFSRYFSTKDSAEFWQSQEKDLTDEGNYVIAARQFERLPQSESLLLKMRDTNCSRTILAKVIVRGGAQYTLRAITDETAGPSAFVSTFFDTFKPADTLFGSSIYISKGKALITDFNSTDSTTKAQARKSIGMANYRDEDAPAIIALIRNWNTTEKNYLEIKRDLIQELGYIKHPAILPFLREAYAAANDTASLQHSILLSLVRQQTAAGYALFSELVMQEIPIFSDDNSLDAITSAMQDSLQLAATLFPDMLKLTALTDYKEPVYGLLAELVDSNAVQPSVYAPYISQIAFDARVEVQKELAGEQNLMDRDDNEHNAGSRMRQENISLHEYAVLLFPYRNSNKNAERFFTRYETSNNPLQQIQLARLYLHHQWPASDSVLLSIAAQEKYRIYLWLALKEINQLDRFPSAWKQQESIAKSVLYGNVPYHIELDSVVLLGKQHTVHRFKKGTVYLYKFRQKEDDEWYLGISGLQPDDEKQSSGNQSLTQFTNIRYSTEKTVNEQFHKVLRQVKYKNRYGWDDDFNRGMLMDGNY